MVPTCGYHTRLLQANIYVLHPWMVSTESHGFQGCLLIAAPDLTLSVTILRKETLMLRTDSPATRDRLIADFRECIDTASSCKSFAV